MTIDQIRADMNPQQAYEQAVLAVKEYVDMTAEIESGKPTQFDEIMHAWFCGFCSTGCKLWFSGNWFQGKVSGLETESAKLRAENAQLRQQLAEARQ